MRLSEFCNNFTEEKIRRLLRRPEIARECHRNGRSLLIESVNRMNFLKTDNYLKWSFAIFDTVTKEMNVFGNQEELLECHCWSGYQKWVIRNFIFEYPKRRFLRIHKRNLEGNQVRFIFIFSIIILRVNG